MLPAAECLGAWHKIRRMWKPVKNLDYGRGTGMADKLHILLIEDKEEDAVAIIRQYGKVIEEIRKWGNSEEYLGTDSIEMQWLRGSRESAGKNSETHYFYDESICDEVRERLAENNRRDVKTGILLDTTLSKEELDKASIGIYTGFKIAREIYRQFEKEAHIFAVTQIYNFSSKVMGVMGTREIQSCYLNKHLVTVYPITGAIARSIHYMYDGKFLSEQQEDKLNQLSLTD